MRYSCAVFDLDGTILDTLDDLTAAVNAGMRAISHTEYTREDVRRMVGHGIRNLIDKAAAGRSKEDTDTAFYTFKDHYSANIAVFTREYNGITQTLTTLKNAGMKLCVCSNKFDAGVQKLIDIYFPGMFDAVCGEMPGIPKKPSPEPVYEVLRRCGAGLDSVCYIGDSGVDVETAAAAGLPCICVSWGFVSKDALKAAGAAVICDTAAELTRALLN